MSKSRFAVKVRQLFCNHRWSVQEWWPLDKNNNKLFEDIGMFGYCERCGKQKIIYPSIPKQDVKQKSSDVNISKKGHKINGN